MLFAFLLALVLTGIIFALAWRLGGARAWRTLTRDEARELRRRIASLEADLELARASGGLDDELLVTLYERDLQRLRRDLARAEACREAV